MKPLELVLWRKCPCEPDCRLMVPKDLEGPDIFETNGVWGDDTKRLTDAELAAEYWRKFEEFGCATEGYKEGLDGYVYLPEEREKELLATIERFAHHDHYDKGDS